jgi:hypothetical protein
VGLCALLVVYARFRHQYHFRNRPYQVNHHNSASTITSIVIHSSLIVYYTNCTIATIITAGVRVTGKRASHQSQSGSLPLLVIGMMLAGLQ